MAKSFKGLVGGDDTQNDCRDQCAECDDIITPASPDKEAEDATYQYKEDKFVGLQRQGDSPLAH